MLLPLPSSGKIVLFARRDRNDGKPRDGEGEDADLTSRISGTKEAETLHSLPFRSEQGDARFGLVPPYRSRASSVSLLPSPVSGPAHGPCPPGRPSK